MGAISLSFWRCYVTSTSVFGANPIELLAFHVNYFLSGVILGIICCIICSIPSLEKNILKRIDLKWLTISIFMGGIVFSYSMFLPNVFTTFFNYHHAGAYFHSIYNVLNGTPYSSESLSVYGHYALFFAPIVKLLNLDYRGLIVFISILSLLSYLCLSYVLVSLIGRNLLSFIGCCFIIVPFSSLSFIIFYQGWPHRLLWNSILMLWLIYINNQKEKDRYYCSIVSFLIPCLALIWNLETGLVCVASKFAYQTFIILQRKSSFNYYLEYIIKELMKSAGCFLCAWELTSVINIILLNGSHISLSDFIFPLATGSILLSSTVTNYQNGIMLWMIIGCFCLVAISYCLSQTIINREFDAIRIDHNSPVLFALVIMTLLQMCYYINRQAQLNILIAVPFAIVLVCFIIKKCMYQYLLYDLASAVKIFLFCLARLLLLSLLAGIFAGIMNLGLCEKNRNDQKMRDLTDFNSTQISFKNILLPNTTYLGTFGDAIYWNLKWKNRYHLIDFQDIVFKPEVVVFFVVCCIILMNRFLWMNLFMIFFPWND